MPTAGDPDRLQQVIWNLLSNAVKFTPAGGGDADRQRRPARSTNRSCSDTGIGIDREFLPNVFETFRQADASTTRAHGGLGLGLSIVKQLVDLHGGEVLVVQRGGGARRHVHRAACRSASIEPQEEARGRRRPRANRRAAWGHDILVVDDNRDARELLVSAFEAARGHVRAASSSRRGPGVGLAQIPEAVIGDLGMPGEDGYIFMERLRSDAGRARRGCASRCPPSPPPATANARSPPAFNATSPTRSIHTRS